MKLTYRSRVSAAALLLAAAVGVPFSGTGVQAADMKIGFLLKTMQEERYQQDKAAFEAKAQELGAEVIFNSANNNEQTQLAKFENMLAKGAQVIVHAAGQFRHRRQHGAHGQRGGRAGRRLQLDADRRAARRHGDAGQLGGRQAAGRGPGRVAEGEEGRGRGQGRPDPWAARQFQRRRDEQRRARDRQGQSRARADRRSEPRGLGAGQGDGHGGERADQVQQQGRRLHRQQ